MQSHAIWWNLCPAAVCGLVLSYSIIELVVVIPLISLYVRIRTMHVIIIIIINTYAYVVHTIIHNVHMHAMYVRGKHYSYYIPQAQPNGAAVMYSAD